MISDGNILAMNGRFSRAYVLLLIATEELSKVRMLISWWDSSEVSEDDI